MKSLPPEQRETVPHKVYKRWCPITDEFYFGQRHTTDKRRLRRGYDHNPRLQELIDAKAVLTVVLYEVTGETMARDVEAQLIWDHQHDGKMLNHESTFPESEPGVDLDDLDNYEPVDKCGTVAGYHRHYRRGESACDGCKAAKARYEARPEGKAYQASYQARYRATPKGKAKGRAGYLRWLIRNPFGLRKPGPGQTELEI